MENNNTPISQEDQQFPENEEVQPIDIQWKYVVASDVNAASEVPAS